MEKHWIDLINNKFIIILLFLIFILLCVVVSVGLFTDRHIKIFGIEFNSEKKETTLKPVSEDKENIKTSTVSESSNNKINVGKIDTDNSQIGNNNIQKKQTIGTKSVINVSSTNQSGGITANEVHVTPKPLPRVLDVNDKSDLLKMLNDKNEYIKVTSLGNDVEAFNLRTQIVTFLKENGYTKIDNVTTMSSVPITGIIRERNSLGVNIIVGTQE